MAIQAQRDQRKNSNHKGDLKLTRERGERMIPRKTRVDIGNSGSEDSPDERIL
jgi:hypothetical protein